VSGRAEARRLPAEGPARRAARRRAARREVLLSTGEVTLLIDHFE